jgi:oxygen-independent coproporphyrinogen III oxidase
VRRTLEQEGYEAIGLDHFARPDDPMTLAAHAGTLRRNFQGYTTDAADALLPFGVSSIGRLPQGYIANAADIASWRRAIEADTFATNRGLAFTRDDIMRGDVIEKLMCDLRVDYGRVAQSHGFAEEALDDAAERLAALVVQDLVTLEGRRVTITEAGRPFVRLAATAFDAYIEANAARHSIAV